MPSEQHDGRHLRGWEEPFGERGEVDQCNRRELFDYIPRGGRPGLTASEEGHRAKHDTIARLVVSEVSSPQHEVKALAAGRTRLAGLLSASAFIGAGLPTKSPRWVADDDIEGASLSAFREQPRALRLGLDIAGISNE